MRRLLVVLCGWFVAAQQEQVAAAQGFSPAGENHNDAWKQCRGNDPDARLIACSRLIDAARDTPARVIDAYPRLAFAHYNRGLCYELIGLDDLAIEDISTSIDIEPRAEFRFERRGTIYFRKNLLDKALADYEAALVINPQYAAALYGRGLIRMRIGDLAAGGADVAAAIRHRPNIAAEMARAGVK